MVFPGQQLPLHIFEPRYLRLVADVVRDEGEFGIALIESGREVGGGALPREVGCAVRITRAAGGAGRSLQRGLLGDAALSDRRNRSGGRRTCGRKSSSCPPPTDAGDEEAAELASDVATLFQDHLGLALAMEGGWQRRLRTPADPVRLADAVAAGIPAPAEQKQAVLEALRVSTRLEIGQRLLEVANQSLREQLAVRRRFKLDGLGARN